MTTTGLRRFLEPAPELAPADGRQRCELCAEPVGERHGHVVNLESRALQCACRACHLLFTVEDPDRRPEGRFRSVPERYLHTPAFRLTEADWTALRIPVRMAFFFTNSALGQTVAFYPSPGGATESTLSQVVWDRVLRANPELPIARPDVEALLIDRRADGFACHLVPIDACYELVGLIRLTWTGFAGGQEAWDAIDAFFTALRQRGGTSSAERELLHDHTRGGPSSRRDHAEVLRPRAGHGAAREEADRG
ncbi:MAG: DUF5947 family protein [Actinomadura sp.]